MWPPVTRQDCSPTGRCSLALRPLLGVSSSLWGTSGTLSEGASPTPRPALPSSLSPKIHLYTAIRPWNTVGGLEEFTVSTSLEQFCVELQSPGHVTLGGYIAGRLLRVPWPARRSNQSILKEISPEYSLEGLMWKLKLQYFGHLIRRTDSLEDTPMLGRIKGRRRRGRQRMRWLDSTTGWMDMNLNKLWEIVKDREAWSAVVRRVTRSWTQLSNWTRTTSLNCIQTDPRAIVHILCIKYRSWVTIAQLTFCRPFSHPYNILF